MAKRSAKGGIVEPVTLRIPRQFPIRVAPLRPRQPEVEEAHRDRRLPPEGRLRVDLAPVLRRFRQDAHRASVGVPRGHLVPMPGLLLVATYDLAQATRGAKDSPLGSPNVEEATVCQR